MKNVRSLLCLAVVAFLTQSASADPDHSVRLLFYKASDDQAKIIIGSKSYLAPISFESGQGLTWADVKDAYYLPPTYAALIKQGRISIYIGCSGAEFHVLKHK